MVQVFGRFIANSDESHRPVHRIGESLATSGTPYARRVPGSKGGGRYTFTAINSGTFAATMTVWYSSLPNPDPDVIGDWWQDTNIGSSGTITLTSGTQGAAAGNIHTPWVLFRITVTSGTLVTSVWYSGEQKSVI